MLWLTSCSSTGTFSRSQAPGDGSAAEPGPASMRSHLCGLIFPSAHTGERTFCQTLKRMSTKQSKLTLVAVDADLARGTQSLGSFKTMRMPRKLGRAISPLRAEPLDNDVGKFTKSIATINKHPLRTPRVCCMLMLPFIFQNNVLLNTGWQWPSEGPEDHRSLRPLPFKTVCVGGCTVASNLAALLCS